MCVVSVCVCVCSREKETGGEKERESKRASERDVDTPRQSQRVSGGAAATSLQSANSLASASASSLQVGRATSSTFSLLKLHYFFIFLGRPHVPTEVNSTVFDLRRFGLKLFFSTSLFQVQFLRLTDASGCSTSTVRLSWTESAAAPTHVSFASLFYSPLPSTSHSCRLFLLSVKFCDVSLRIYAHRVC